MIVGKRDGKRNPGKKCPNAKSGFPRDRSETIIKNVSVLSRGKPLFCVWAFFARIPFPIPKSRSESSFPFKPRNLLKMFLKLFFKIKLVGCGHGTECVLDVRVHRGTPKGTDGEK